jgi:hypothetical protein
MTAKKELPALFEQKIAPSLRQLDMAEYLRQEYGAEVAERYLKVACNLNTSNSSKPRPRKRIK